MRTTKWNTLVDDHSRALYLYELIKDKTGHQIQALLEYEKETKHQMRLLEKAQEEKTPEDTSLTAREMEMGKGTHKTASLPSETIEDDHHSIGDIRFHDVMRRGEDPGEVPDAVIEETMAERKMSRATSARSVDNAQSVSDGDMDLSVFFPSKAQPGMDVDLSSDCKPSPSNERTNACF